MTDKNAFLEQNSKRRFLELPELESYGLRCEIQSLFEHEMNAFELSLQDKSGKTTKRGLSRLRSTFIVMTAVDPETKQPIFTDADIDRLQKLDGGLMRWWFDTASEHCGMKPGELEAMVTDPFTEEPAPS